MNSRQKQLLREHIRKIISEDDGGSGDYGGMYAANTEMAPFGMHFAGKNQLYNTFVKPFVDVIDTAAGKAKETTSRALTVVKVAFESIAVVMLPWLTDDYSEIFADEKLRLDKIKAEYSEVYRSNWDAFKTSDVAMTAFFCFPGSFLTSVIAKKTPDVAFKLVSVLSGGTMDNFLSDVKTKFSHSKNKKSSIISGEKYAGKWPIADAIIHERHKNDTSIEQQFANTITDKKVIDKALSSPQAQEMQRKARESVKKTLKIVYDRAREITTTKNVNDMQQIFGKHISGMDEFNKIDEKQRAQAESYMMKNVKASSKEFYAKNLEAQATQAVKDGVPEGCPYVKMYRSVAKKIRML